MLERYSSLFVRFALSGMVASTLGCADTPKNSKKKALSEEVNDPDALFSDNAIANGEESGILAGTTGKTTKSAASAQSPTWSVPGSPQTAAQPTAAIDEPISVPAKVGAKQILKAAIPNLQRRKIVDGE